VEGSLPNDKPLPTQSDIPNGLALIATCLKSAGYYPSIFVFTPNSDIETILNDYIDENKPKLFCLSAVSTQFPLIMDIAERIKKKDPYIFIVLGGVHATLNPEMSIQQPFVDAICIGEGEKAVVELANQIKNGNSPSHINNLWIKNLNGIEKNPTSEFIEDLDSIPIIDKSLWFPWVKDINYNTSILIGRGCPNKCSYCCNHKIAKASSGKYVRFRSPENIIEEINQIITSNPKIDLIYLECESINVNLSYLLDLLKKIENFNAKISKPICFSANITIAESMVNDPIFLEHLNRANFITLKIGLESGSERIRKEVLRRPPYSNDEIITLCQNIKKTGIKVILYVMMGLPTETIADYQETVDCVRKCAPDAVYLNIYYPYPGTDLYQREKDLGLFTDHIIRTDSERKTPVIDRPGFSKMQVRIEFILFYLKSLHGIYPNSKILRLTLYNIVIPHINASRIINKIFHNT
jgi:anaerobic magnesium-protoporphyrin IX monomethyl ester cyclase